MVMPERLQDYCLSLVFVNIEPDPLNERTVGRRFRVLVPLSQVCQRFLSVQFWGGTTLMDIAFYP